jgi:hypothetical protein
VATAVKRRTGNTTEIEPQGRKALPPQKAGATHSLAPKPHGRARKPVIPIEPERALHHPQRQPARTDAGRVIQPILAAIPTGSDEAEF